LVVPLNGVTSLRESRRHTLPFYWQPTIQSFPFVDAIICTSTHVVLLQCTVSMNHGTNVEALTNILGTFKPTFLNKRRVALVCTVDKDATALRLASPKFKRLASDFRLSIYSCVYLPSFRSPLADTVNVHLNVPQPPSASGQSSKEAAEKSSPLVDCDGLARAEGSSDRDGEDESLRVDTANANCMHDVSRLLWAKAPVKIRS